MDWSQPFIPAMRLEPRFGIPTIDSATMVEPRLYGTYKGGKLSFGALDPLWGSLFYTNSLGTLILAYPTFLVPFVTWLLMGFFKSIPRDESEVRKSEGAAGACPALTPGSAATTRQAWAPACRPPADRVPR